MIGSTKQIEEKMLRNSIVDFKEDLEQGNVNSYNWLATKDMLADILTKECRKNSQIIDVMSKNTFENAISEKNSVTLGDGKIKMTNKTNV